MIQFTVNEVVIELTLAEAEELLITLQTEIQNAYIHENSVSHTDSTEHD